jgi:predicted ribosome quality control (RQC) complex YloA/Tae2 family protein
MSEDIVHRLRNDMPQGIMRWREIALEAADEIERLKTDAALWESRTKQGAEIIMGNVAEIERLMAEIKRLRAALEKIEEETERTCQQCRLIENIARAALEPKP